MTKMVHFMLCFVTIKAENKVTLVTHFACIVFAIAESRLFWCSFDSLQLTLLPESTMTPPAELSAQSRAHSRCWVNDHRKPPAPGRWQEA